MTDTYTLYLPDPLELSGDLEDVLQAAGHQLKARGLSGTFRLVDDLSGQVRHVSRHTCLECGREMNPAERILGAVCGPCVRRLHREAIRR